ncbi:MAG: fused MFS/spermidine synthase [Acidimicrobiia bacterium]
MTRGFAAALLFVLSGAVLVMEILAARLLAPVVGLSLETYTAIIGVVLAGISVGHAVGGQLADRYGWRLVLAPCIAAGGLLTLAIVPAITILGEGVDDPGVIDAVALALAAFFFPTAALSAAAPIVTKAQLQDLEETGRVVGSLSAWSTAGALVGTFLTGFVFVVSFRTSRILYTLGASLVVLAILLLPRSRRWRGSAIVIVALLAGVLPAAIPGRCHTETPYYRVRIRASRVNPDARVLSLDRLSHSYVDLEDKAKLGFRYQRVVASILEALPAGEQPARVLHIGGGGFAFPRYVAARNPGSYNRVLELDPELPNIAAERLDFDLESADVSSGDARASLRSEPAGHYDLVVSDAFGSLDPPWHLATAEAARLVRRTLSRTGVFAMNIVDAGSLEFLGAGVATLRSVFPYVAVIVPPRGSAEEPSNSIIVASARPVELDLDPDDGRVLTTVEVERLVDDAPVLTDDFAPVERLISRRR